MKVTVHVTKDDLLNSLYDDITNYGACAKALRRNFPQAGSVNVGAGTFYIGDDQYAIPKRAAQELEEVMLTKTRPARAFWFKFER